MAQQTLTLNLPEPLFGHLQERAKAANRSVEAEVLYLVAASVPDSTHPEAVAAYLALLDDPSLWKAARGTIAAETTQRIEELHHQRQRAGLTTAESDALAGLMRQYERAILMRAQAAELLRHRGHDVSTLVAP